MERQINGQWLQTTNLHAKDMDLNDYFGRNVAISGDYIIIGAFREDGIGGGGEC